MTCIPIKEARVAFNLFSWLLGTTDKANVTKGELISDSATDSTGIENLAQEMAFWAITRRVGAAVAACDYKTYRRGIEVNADEYWAWNVEPNANQTKSEFFTKLVSMLFIAGEVLIVEDKHGNRYVADSYSTHYDSTNGDYYTDIEIWQGAKLQGAVLQKEAIVLRLSGSAPISALSGFSKVAGDMIDSAVKAYIRGQGNHGILNIDDVAAGDPDFNAKYKDLVTDKFKKFFTAGQAVLPLFSGYSYQDLGSTGAGDTRDVRKMIDDIQEMTARALGVPKSIVTGEGVTDKDFADFITTVVRPITEAFVQECNRKLYGKKLWRSGSRMAADLGGVKYVDMFGSAAQGADKLIGSGICSINDVMVRFGLPRVSEAWADQHWMTKNYSPAETLLDGLEATETGQESLAPDSSIDTQTDNTDTDTGGNENE